MTMALSEKLIIIITAIPFILLISLGAFFFFTTDAGRSFLPASLDRSRIEFTGISAAATILSFIDSLEVEDGNYYESLTCLKSCELNPPTSGYNGVQRRREAMVHYVEAEASGDTSDYMMLAKSFDDIKTAFDREPLNKFMSFMHAWHLYEMLDSGVIATYPETRVLKEELHDSLRPIALDPSGILLSFDEYADKPIDYYETPLSSVLPVSAKKSYALQNAKGAVTYAYAYKIFGNASYHYAAKQIISNANVWFSTFSEDLPIDENGLYKEGSCFLPLAHLVLYDGTGNDAYLQYAKNYFSAIDFNAIYTRNIGANPQHANKLGLMLPCVDALLRLSRETGDDAYVKTARTMMNYYLGNVFDVDGLSGFVHGTGGIASFAGDLHTYDLYENAYFAHMLLQPEIENYKFEYTNQTYMREQS